MPNHWTVPALITRVIDADTYQADLDLGWRVWIRDARIRLAGLNAPEINTRQGAVARDWVIDRFTRLQDAPAGVALRCPVTVSSHSLDKYGRVLGTVYLSPGMSINDELLANGYAQAVR